MRVATFIETVEFRCLCDKLWAVHQMHLRGLWSHTRDFRLPRDGEDFEE